MELGEASAVAQEVVHEPGNSACPFCPKEATQDWKTHIGDATKSTVLRVLLEKPHRLPEVQSKARPKQKHQYEKERRATPEHKAFTFAAHHLISGKQVLAKAPSMVAWISKDAEDSRVSADSGYSVNNAANGIWLPSIPHKAIVGRWTDLEDKDQLKWAIKGMNVRLDDGVGPAVDYRQFHVGNHHVETPEDDDDRHYAVYDTYLIDVLNSMANRIGEWNGKCKLHQNPKSKTKLRPSAEMNAILDRFSARIARHLTSEPETWRMFVSRYAVQYHVNRCAARGRKPKYPAGSC